MKTLNILGFLSVGCSAGMKSVHLSTERTKHADHKWSKNYFIISMPVTLKKKTRPKKWLGKLNQEGTKSLGPVIKFIAWLSFS